MQRLRRILLVFTVAASIGVAVWLIARRAEQPQNQSTAAHAKLDSHARMIAALEKVRQRSLIDDPYFQTRRIEEEGRELAEMARFGDNRGLFQLHVSQADDYRRIGENDLAIKHIRQAEELVQRFGVKITPDEQEILTYENGVTYLRKGETENCLHCISGESCILPIQGGGIHANQTGSRKAMEYFEQVLRKNPKHLRARWLLNVAAMTLGEFPDGVPESMRLPPERFRSDVDFPRFREIGRDVGLRTVDCAGAAIVDDFDNDGRFDVLAATWDPGGQIHLYRNTGKGDFADVTEQANLKGILGGINGVQADYDNDGLVDVYLVRGAWLGEVGQDPNSLLRNLGGGRFRDVTFDVGLADVNYPSSDAAWFDFDLDGDLDLFVCNEVAPCQLFRNDGPGGFVDVAPAAGVTNGRFTKGSSWGDFDGDRRPDLYVSNLDGPNRLYRNNGDGTFTDVAEKLGVHLPLKSFPTWFWDVNNDGNLDLYVASYDVGIEHMTEDYAGLPRTDEPDRLYLGDGAGGFRDATTEYGLTRATQPMGCNFGDLDNDGFLDFYLGTGYPEIEGIMPNIMYHNLNGKKFEDVSLAGGFAHLQKGHGTAFADLDNDGDQDVFMQMGGALPGDAFGNVLYENPGFGRHWIRLKLVGTTSNRSAIGARIKIDVVEDGRRRSIFKWVNSGASFGAAPLQQQIGLGSAASIESLQIDWPAVNSTSSFENLPADRLVEIHEGAKDYQASEIVPFAFKTAASD